MEAVVNSKNLIGWLLILGPLTVFIFGALLDGILIGEGATPTDAVTEMTAKQGLKHWLTVLGSLGFVFAFIGTVLLCDSMQGDNKPGRVFARIGMIIFTALVALAMAASMTDLASLAAIQEDVTESTSAAMWVEHAVTIHLVGQTLWSGLFFFWGIGFIMVGIALIMQKKLHIIVDWIFVVFGALFVILTVTPLDLAQTIGFVVFGIMVLNTIAAGVFQLRANES